MASRDLFDELRVNGKLAEEFKIIYNESLHIWQEQHLREYTTHGEDHTKQVERNLDCLTRPLQKSKAKLTSQEIFVLLSASCLHDIGMQLADDPNARANHARAAYQLIREGEARVGSKLVRVPLTINDDRARRAIALVARAHWTEFALPLPSEDAVYANETGRHRLLGALLAMADLLDLSPIRARFFRSRYRLYSLPPKSELHQTMHDLVHYFKIQQVGHAQDLQFQLYWVDDNREVRDLSEWVMSWFQSQWRQLQKVLYNESEGIIRWANPWARIIFNPPESGASPRRLGAAACREFEAERAEQARINREEFISTYRSSIESKTASLFLLSNSVETDGNKISEWCYAQSRLIKDCLVARVYAPPTVALDMRAIISLLIEEWEQQLPPEKQTNASAARTSDRGTLNSLKSFLSEHADYSFVSVIVTEGDLNRRLQNLIRVLVAPPPKGSSGARVCLLLTPGAPVFKALNNCQIHKFAAIAFPRAEVEGYLRKRWAFNQMESQNIYNALSGLGFADKPLKMYEYLDTHWRLFSGNYYESA